jgi:hypothetical protein
MAPLIAWGRGQSRREALRAALDSGQLIAATASVQCSRDDIVP